MNEEQRWFKVAVFAALASMVGALIVAAVVVVKAHSQAGAAVQPAPRPQPFTVDYTVLTDTNATIVYVTMPGTEPGVRPAQCLIVIAPDGRSTSISCVR